MKRIGILSRWNATCGISMHAELVVNEFLKKGYHITVFAPTVESASKWWHHKIIRENDEDFVLRCYEEVDPSGKGGKIDENLIFSEDFDIFIVESYASLPYKEVEKILEKIKEKSKTVVIIHEGSKSQIKYSSLNIFDAVVVFDERYVKEVINNACSRDKIHIIPYPCIYDEIYVKKRKKEIIEEIYSREKKEKITFFSFGRQPVQEYNDYINALKELKKKYNLVYRIVRSDGLLNVKEQWIEQISDRPDTEKLFKYFEKADVHLLPKGKTSYVVVSSTLCQCISSLCPIVVPNTRHFETLPSINGVKPAVVYEDLKDLIEKLEMLIEDKEYKLKVVEAAEEYARENSVENVAKKFENLFDILMKS